MQDTKAANVIKLKNNVFILMYNFYSLSFKLLLRQLAFQILQRLLHLVSCNAGVQGHLISTISMNRVWRECWNAHSNVLRSLWRRAAVLNPFPGLNDDRLPGLHVERRVF